MKPLLWVLLAAAALLSPTLARAEPQDVPRGHWAYEAVQDLANKGLVLGYSDGKFLGNRTLSRYEMAALTKRVIDRLEQRITEVASQASSAQSKAEEAKTAAEEAKNAARTTPPTTVVEPPSAVPGVTREDLDAVQKLVDEFKVELTVMGENLEKVRTELDALKEDVEGVKSMVEGMNDQIKLHDADIATLKKTKVSGYIQARYESNPTRNVIKLGTAAPKGSFYIRRGRLKVAHTGSRSDYVLQGDFTESGVSLKDAYIDWYLQPRSDEKQPLMFTFGRFNVPFGHEIEYSSSVREMPERSFGENALFPGERDSGIKVAYGLTKHTIFDASILNGGGNKSSAPETADNHKDITARLRHQFSSTWDLGLSGYWGKQTAGGSAAVAATPGSVQWKDTNSDGIVDIGELIPIAGKPAVAAVPAYLGDRNRYGVDTQIYQILGGTIRAEYWWGSNAAANGTNPSVSSWYAQYAHDVMKDTTLAIRYDTYDPNTKVASDHTSRVGVALLRYFGDNLRLTAAYDFITHVPAGYYKRNWFTFQAQHKF
ncbi:MAG TPA: porin [Armatimonadota bacterium]